MGQSTIAFRGRTADVYAVETESTIQPTAEGSANRSDHAEQEVSALSSPCSS